METPSPEKSFIFPVNNNAGAPRLWTDDGKPIGYSGLDSARRLIDTLYQIEQYTAKNFGLETAPDPNFNWRNHLTDGSFPINANKYGELLDEYDPANLEDAQKFINFVQTEELDMANANWYHYLAAGLMDPTMWSGWGAARAITKFGGLALPKIEKVAQAEKIAENAITSGRLARALGKDGPGRVDRLKSAAERYIHNAAVFGVTAPIALTPNVSARYASQELFEDEDVAMELALGAIGAGVLGAAMTGVYGGARKWMSRGVSPYKQYNVQSYKTYIADKPTIAETRVTFNMQDLPDGDIAVIGTDTYDRSITGTVGRLKRQGTIAQRRGKPIKVVPKVAKSERGYTVVNDGIEIATFVSPPQKQGKRNRVTIEDTGEIFIDGRARANLTETPNSYVLKDGVPETFGIDPELLKRPPTVLNKALIYEQIYLNLPDTDNVRKFSLKGKIQDQATADQFAGREFRSKEDIMKAAEGIGEVQPTDFKVSRKILDEDGRHIADAYQKNDTGNISRAAMTDPGVRFVDVDDNFSLVFNDGAHVATIFKPGSVKLPSGTTSPGITMKIVGQDDLYNAPQSKPDTPVQERKTGRFTYQGKSFANKKKLEKFIKSRLPKEDTYSMILTMRDGKVKQSTGGSVEAYEAVAKKVYGNLEEAKQAGKVKIIKQEAGSVEEHLKQAVEETEIVGAAERNTRDFKRFKQNLKKDFEASNGEGWWVIKPRAEELRSLDNLEVDFSSLADAEDYLNKTLNEPKAGPDELFSWVPESREAPAEMTAPLEHIQKALRETFNEVAVQNPHAFEVSGPAAVVKLLKGTKYAEISLLGSDLPAARRFGAKFNNGLAAHDPITGRSVAATPGGSIATRAEHWQRQWVLAKRESNKQWRLMKTKEPKLAAELIRSDFDGLVNRRLFNPNENITNYTGSRVFGKDRHVAKVDEKLHPYLDAVANEYLGRFERMIAEAKLISQETGRDFALFTRLGTEDSREILDIISRVPDPAMNKAQQANFKKFIEHYVIQENNAFTDAAQEFFKHSPEDILKGLDDFFKKNNINPDDTHTNMKPEGRFVEVSLKRVEGVNHVYVSIKGTDGTDLLPIGTWGENRFIPNTAARIHIDPEITAFRLTAAQEKADGTITGHLTKRRAAYEKRIESNDTRKIVPNDATTDRRIKLNTAVAALRNQEDPTLLENNIKRVYEALMEFKRFKIVDKDNLFARPPENYAASIEEAAQLHHDMRFTDIRKAGDKDLHKWDRTQLRDLIKVPRYRQTPGGAMLNDFLDTNTESVMQFVFKTVGGDIELHKAFGTVAPTSNSSPVMQDLKRDAQLAIESEPDNVNKILREESLVVEQMEALVQRARGQRGKPDDPSGAAYRFGSFVRLLAPLLSYGSIMLSQLSDIAMLPMRAGMSLVKYPMQKFSAGMRKRLGQEMTEDQKRQLAMTAFAIEMEVNSRFNKLMDLDNDIGYMGKTNQYLKRASDKFGKVALFQQMNAGTKTIAANATHFEIAEKITMVAKGTTPKGKKVSAGRQERALRYLHSLGLDDKHIKSIDEMMDWQPEGREHKGFAVTDPDEWEKINSPVARDNYRALEAAITTNVDNIIVTPRTELPTFIDKNMTMKLLWQITSFLWAAGPRMFLKSFQAFPMHPTRVVANLPFLFMGGVAAWYANAFFKGGKSWDYARNADWETVLDEGINRFGPLGPILIAKGIAEAIPGISPMVTFGGGRTFRSSRGDPLFRMLGLHYGTAKSAQNVVTSLHNPTEQTARALGDLFPGTNLFYLNRMNRIAEEELADWLDWDGQKPRNIYK